jgi:hypothetical protein
MVPPFLFLGRAKLHRILQNVYGIFVGVNRKGYFQNFSRYRTRKNVPMPMATMASRNKG